MLVNLSPVHYTIYAEGKQYSPLPNTFNIKNTTDLLHNLLDTPICPQFTFSSLDITNLYSNIPVNKTKVILADTLKYYQTDPQKQQEILSWYDVITTQNYFTHNQGIITPKDGIAMGAPSSALIAEFFLQRTENTHLPHKHRIINYFRYVDDILLIFDSTHTDIQTILTDFNALHPNLHFTGVKIFSSGAEYWRKRQIYP